MDKNCIDCLFFYSEIPKKIGLNLTPRSKVTALLIFTKFRRDLMEVRHLVHYSR
jgi:hypothetical protein